MRITNPNAHNQQAITKTVNSFSLKLPHVRIFSIYVKVETSLATVLLPLLWLPVKAVTLLISILSSVADVVAFIGSKSLTLILLIYLLYRLTAKIVFLNEMT